MRNALIYIFVLLLTRATLSATASAPGASAEPRRAILKGRVYDSETKAPLIGASVIITGSSGGTETDSTGTFVIKSLPVGSYRLRVSYVGYRAVVLSDIILKSSRTTQVTVELKPVPVSGKGIQVTAGFFPAVDDHPLSTVTLNAEETRRAPGSAGDVSRVLNVLPSIARLDDRYNTLVVRGGSPMENGIYIDNVEVPNINHFGAQGSSGGPLGLLNVDLIRKVEFYSGGFGAAYGNHLSSVMELELRDGSRDGFSGQVDLSLSGLGLIFEGPLWNGKGSWVASARRGFLDLLLDVLQADVTPNYNDFQVKLVYDLTTSDRLSFIGIVANSDVALSKDIAEESSLGYYGTTDFSTTIMGVNWRRLWGRRIFSNTSLAFTRSNYIYDSHQLASGSAAYVNNSTEYRVALRNRTHYRVNDRLSLEFGTKLTNLITDYDYQYGPHFDVFGFLVDSLIVAGDANLWQSGTFISGTLHPVSRLSVTAGIRLDHFSYNDEAHLSPRLSTSFKITEKTRLNLAFGTYYQNLPFMILSQRGFYDNLSDPRAHHYVAGIDHLLSADTRLTLEAYAKNYAHFPVDPNMPTMFVIDELIYHYGIFVSRDSLTDDGTAYSRGLELMIQKRMGSRLGGILSFGLSQVRYRDNNNVLYNRLSDNGFVASIEVNYKPGPFWDLSFRWHYAGGAPYTPFDEALSQQWSEGLLDRDRINDVGLPDYHSLNLRLDRHFYFSGSNLTVYFSIWNVYNRENVAGYYWSEADQVTKPMSQLMMFPLMGIEYEF